MELKRTPLYEIHKAMGAKMVSFAGWEMPLQYSGIIEEHTAVRTSVGLFDVSHMGQIEVSGKGALEAIQSITTNDASLLSKGRVQYTLLCNEKGGIIDDVTLYMLDEDSFLFCVNASNTEKDYQWIKERIGGMAVVQNKSYAFCLLALQGPEAQNLLQRLCDETLSTVRRFHFKRFKVGSFNSLVSRTGYTGEDGFEIYLTPSDAPFLWKRLLEEGKGFKISPCGLGARDTLRLEMRYCLYGHELSESTSPLEAGLVWAVKFDKGDFIGRGALINQRSRGVKRRLVGFEMVESGIPRHNYPIILNGKKIGEVTSGTFSPTLKRAIGLGYVSKELSSIGQEFYIDIRGRERKAVIVKTPFVKKPEFRDKFRFPNKINTL